MKIALVTPYFPDAQTLDSGIANHYQLLAQSLAALGHRIIVLHVRPRYMTDADDFNRHDLDEGITVLTYKVKTPGRLSRFFEQHWALNDFALKLRSMRVASRAIRRITREYGIDVIETTSYFSLSYFLNTKKISAPMTVRVSTAFSQIMNEHYPFRSRLMDLIAKMEIGLIRKSPYLLTHAHSHARELDHLYGVAASRFEIIPHGVRLPDLATAEPGDKAVRILFTGRLEYRKAADVLLKAIPLVLKECPGVLFEIIGNDPGEDHQRGLETENSGAVLQKVLFRGKVAQEQLAQAYRACDIFVAPSRYESFGLIFIEAMSYGKPVIGCKVGGVKEIIVNNFNGLFAETGDAQSLAGQMILLIKDRDLRMTLGRNARKTVEDKFTGEQLAVDSLNYYQRLINQHQTWRSR